MVQRRDPIDNLRIAAPCPAKWEGMAGDERMRHCTLCDLNVYNFAAMTGDEIRELITRAEGRVCARLYRRADGTVLTRDCPTGLRALRRRVSRSMSAMTAALLSIAALFTGCATRSRFEVVMDRAATVQPALLAGVVRDETGTPLPGVSVMVRDEALRTETFALTDATGTFTIGSLREGSYRVEVIFPSFKTAVVEHLSLKQGDVVRADVTLRLDRTMITVIVGAIAVDDTAMTNGISTTFSQDLIDKLPR